MKLWQVHCTIAPDNKKYYVENHYVVAETKDKASIMIKNMYKNTHNICLIDYIEMVSMSKELIIV